MGHHRSPRHHTHMNQRRLGRRRPERTKYTTHCQMDLHRRSHRWMGKSQHSRHRILRAGMKRNCHFPSIHQSRRRSQSCSLNCRCCRICREGISCIGQFQLVQRSRRNRLLESFDSQQGIEYCSECLQLDSMGMSRIVHSQRRPSHKSHHRRKKLGKLGSQRHIDRQHTQRKHQHLPAHIEDNLR